ncbi:hypothetical protein BD626DRAFT_566247 [Schizophyllum amplum]|uniref:Uncharacterized protein n=1 Tax=Schizophyllum amplum TaxID=97359 RepID=A0A550CQZ5_9AGAR|nr:hypothetical protein BD626DRAFT_566247 [Auriculariopsis ampla]
MASSRDDLADPLVDERLLPHIFTDNNPLDPLRGPPSPRRLLEPENTDMFVCHTANRMARPTIGSCVETLTRPGWCRTNLDPPMQHGPFLMPQEANDEWYELAMRQDYTDANTIVDTQLIARHWPEHVGHREVYHYAPFYHNLFPNEFPLLERVAPHLSQAARGILSDAAPTVRDLPVGVLSLDADRPTTEAFEMGSEIIVRLQEVLYYLSLRKVDRAQEVAEALVQCSRAVRLLVQLERDGLNNNI